MTGGCNNNKNHLPAGYNMAIEEVLADLCQPPRGADGHEDLSATAWACRVRLNPEDDSVRCKDGK